MNGDGGGRGGRREGVAFVFPVDPVVRWPIFQEQIRAAPPDLDGGGSSLQWRRTFTSAEMMVTMRRRAVRTHPRNMVNLLSSLIQERLVGSRGLPCLRITCCCEEEEDAIAWTE